MADFKIKDGEKVRTTLAPKASATVIETGDLVAVASGLIIKATALSTEVALCTKGAGDGETEVEVTVGNDFTLVGTADANFAAANRGTTVDVVVASGAQQIDLGSSSLDVLRVGISKTAGTVGSAADVEVRIEKPLY